MHKTLAISFLVVFVLLISGFAVLFEADSSVWAQTYDGGVVNSLITTSDGGYVVAGDTSFSWESDYDVFLTKFDASGNMEWNKTYGETGDERAHSVVAASDGGYVIAGFTTSFGAGNYDFWLVKTDVSGNVEWNKTYGGGRNEYAYSLVVAPDGGFVIAGSTGSFGRIDLDDSDNFWLVKTDASGNEEWNQTYSRGITERITSLVVTSDGGYALAGYSYHSGRRPLTPYRFWLVKTDEFGNAEWNQSYWRSDYDRAYVLVETSDGGYVIAGETSSLDGSGQDFWLVKTDESGNMEWNQIYGRSGIDDAAHLLVETSDGGYALAGGGFLVKTDELGDAEWSQTYEQEIGLLVEQPDGGYVIADPIYSTTTQAYSIWSIKTDEYGVGVEFHIPDVGTPSPWLITAAAIAIAAIAIITILFYFTRITKKQKT